MKGIPPVALVAAAAAALACSVITPALGQSRESPGQRVDPSAPLGSRQNPVRAHRPAGEREYLLRLRCPNGSAPEFKRAGSIGVGPYGNILDEYEVRCGAAEPARVVMDMYHPGHREMVAVPGFALEPELRARDEKDATPRVPVFSGRPQDWVVVHEWGSGSKTLVDTSDVWKDGHRRLAWLKYQLQPPAKLRGADKEVKELINLEEYDCAAAQVRRHRFVPVFVDSTVGAAVALEATWVPAASGSEVTLAYLCRGA